MHVQIINFQLKDLSETDYAAVCNDLAPVFAEVPGLLAKVWLANSTTQTYGGVYLWQDRKASSAQTIVIEASEEEEEKEQGLGLGIDAGGTYTDAVIYEFLNNRILQKSKALTTKWDFSIGIKEALEQLDTKLLPDIDLVSVSTTVSDPTVCSTSGTQ